jgi:hypothetical protein
LPYEITSSRNVEPGGPRRFASACARQQVVAAFRLGMERRARFLGLELLVDRVDLRQYR